MCAKATASKQVVQEAVVANLKGDLANVFVKVSDRFRQDRRRPRRDESLAWLVQSAAWRGWSSAVEETDFRVGPTSSSPDT
jgi:hypothetical protein